MTITFNLSDLISILFRVEDAEGNLHPTEQPTQQPEGGEDDNGSEDEPEDDEQDRVSE